MINKIIYFTCFIMLSLSSIKAQSDIENVLIEINKNNKSIKANQKYAQAINLQYKIGITLQNPSVEYEYLFGSPANAGNQSDILISQSFDFPTAYSKRKQVSELQIDQTEFKLAVVRQNILLNAKHTCIELIYLNKKKIELDIRVKKAVGLLSDYKKSLKYGEANILNVNKAKLQLINLQNDIRSNSSQIDQLNQKLTGYNGGIPIQFSYDQYHASFKIHDFNSLLDLIAANNPILKSLHQEGEINKKKVELVKAMTLPKIEAGYRYQAILGQQYNGVHLGLTIPLWEHKNKVEFQTAITLFDQVKIEEHKIQFNSTIKQLFDKHQSLNISLIEYRQILGTINNIELLDKALKLGEISSIQYFMEVNYFYNSFDKYLELEREYHLVKAKLLRFQL